MKAATSKSRASRLIGATAASVLCAVAFAGLATAPAQAAVDPGSCTGFGGRVIDGGACEFLGAPRASEAAARQDLPGLHFTCGRAHATRILYAGARQLARPVDGNRWIAVTRCTN
jgi:hypothetical protein